MPRSLFAAIVSLPGLLAGGSWAAAQEAPQELAARAQGILERNCGKCHGQAGTNAGGVNYILDVKKLVEKKRVVPGDPAKSRLVRLVSDGEMPPEDEKVRPSKEDLATLEKWVRAGAPAFVAAAARPYRSVTDTLAAVRDHLRKLPREDRPFQRYFSLTHLHNNPALGDADLRLARAATSKLVNSLSWKSGIVVPQAVDPAGTVLAVDLRRLDWDRCHLWTEILRSYPYGLKYDRVEDDALRELAREVYELAGTDLPVVRADWFVATAARPPLYHHLLYATLLRLPGESVTPGGPRPRRVMTAGQLEGKLGVDVADNFRKDKLARAGFTQSGVSAQNRLVERHESPYGAYWKSYDFKTNDGTGNLFRYPLGPRTGGPDDRQAFVHDGGEVIFHLPNGLQGYLLVDGKDERIDEGPVEVVSDRDRASGTVRIVNGVSCMACHKHGMVTDFKDTVRDGTAVLGDARDKVRRLHPRPERMDELLKEDADRFVAALGKAAGPFLKAGPDEAKDIRDFKEPVSELAGRFVRAEVGLAEAAYELGLADPARLAAAVQASDRLRELGLAPLARKATIKREVWESLAGFTSPFQEAAGVLDLGTPKRVR